MFSKTKSTLLSLLSWDVYHICKRQNTSFIKKKTQSNYQVLKVPRREALVSWEQGTAQPAARPAATHLRDCWRRELCLPAFTAWMDRSTASQTNGQPAHTCQQSKLWWRRGGIWKQRAKARSTWPVFQSENWKQSSDESRARCTRHVCSQQTSCTEPWRHFPSGWARPSEGWGPLQVPRPPVPSDSFHLTTTTTFLFLPPLPHAFKGFLMIV